jgi:hypothetical protein
MTNLPTTSVPVPAPKAPWYKPWLAEAKVLAMTGIVAVVMAVGSLLDNLHGNAALMSPLPGWVQTLVLLVGGTASAYLTGWAARHTPRN